MTFDKRLRRISRMYSIVFEKTLVCPKKMPLLVLTDSGATVNVKYLSV